METNTYALTLAAWFGENHTHEAYYQYLDGVALEQIEDYIEILTRGSNYFAAFITPLDGSLADTLTLTNVPDQLLEGYTAKMSEIIASLWADREELEKSSMTQTLSNESISDFINANKIKHLGDL